MRLRRRRNMFRDYDRARRRRRRLALAVLSGAAVLAVAFFVLMVHNPLSVSYETAADEPLHESGTDQADVAVVPAAVDDGVHLVEPPLAEAEAAAEAGVETVEGVVKSGDTAAALLDSYLSPAEIYTLNKASKEVYPLSRMRAGRPYRLVSDQQGLQRFEYEIDSEGVLVISRAQDGYEVRREAIEYETETRTVYGKITSSLFGAVAEAGESPALAVRLADIFAWDIDFIRDIRVGDSFAAIVEKRSRDGEFAGYGRILAAQFVNQDQAFNGFLFADTDGQEQYFDEQGRSLRKAFLKAPLNFSRISSGFNLNRLHPVLGYRRPHPAIDYAAPSGTPIKTVGDGVVSSKGWDKGGGNYVKIRHNSVYETVYMHMRGFAKGIKKGQRVHQGQIIGYVGSTGIATGPHLDYRIKKNGSYVNPTTIKSPSCKPVDKERMAEFMQLVQPLMAQLHGAGLMRAAAQGGSAGVDVALTVQ